MCNVAARRIEFNRIHDVGEATRDFGAISLIGYARAPLTGTVIAHNCVRGARGVFPSTSIYGSPDGELEIGYQSYSIYLDNYASGYTIEGNVFNNAAQANVFIHLGRGNTIVNNVLANATASAGVGAPLQVEGKRGLTANNTFARNIVLAARTPTERGLYSITTTWDPQYLRPDAVRDNLYWSVARAVFTRLRSGVSRRCSVISAHVAAESHQRMSRRTAATCADVTEPRRDMR